MDNIEKRIKQAISFDSPTYLNFVSESQAALLLKKYPNQIKLISRIKDSEYSRIVVSNHSIDDSKTSVIEISYPNKFVTLTHRDVLGAIMSLKIKREVFGDIIFNNNKIYIEVIDQFVDYFLLNLTQIKHSQVKLKTTNELILAFKNYKSYDIIISSLRLDNIIAAITGFSRNTTREYILEKNVKVNHEICENISYQVKENDLLSLKKFGRFKIISELKKTKKDKTVLQINQYI